MEGSAVLSSSFPSKPPFKSFPSHTLSLSSSPSASTSAFLKSKFANSSAKLQSNPNHMFISCASISPRTLTPAVDEALDSPARSLPSSSSSREALPRIDKSGRFCSPRAARELALLTLYAACLEGSDAVRLFERRLNARREPGYEFDKNTLLDYNHMNFGGPPVTTDSIDEADELMRIFERESEIEAAVLSAPPKLVYSKLILRFTRKLLVAVVDQWDSHVAVIDKLAPSNWKNEPTGRILELSILHLAMSEIGALGTRHQIVINEAVDLAKRFCDGAAPRIVNGCLRNFVEGLVRL